jgi:hypothetical protein
MSWLLIQMPLSLLSVTSPKQSLFSMLSRYPTSKTRKLPSSPLTTKARSTPMTWSSIWRTQVPRLLDPLLPQTLPSRRLCRLIHLCTFNHPLICHLPHLASRVSRSLHSTRLPCCHHGQVYLHSRSDFPLPGHLSRPCLHVLRKRSTRTLATQITLQ